jgi:transposase-like protein
MSAKMFYTTNAVEALHRSLRKIIKTSGSFPNDDAALKLLYLAIKNAGLRWRRRRVDAPISTHTTSMTLRAVALSLNTRSRKTLG